MKDTRIETPDLDLEGLTQTLSNFFASAALCIVVGSLFIVRSGHPWFIVPMIPIFITFAAHTLDLLIASFCLFGIVGFLRAKDTSESGFKN